MKKYFKKLIHQHFKLRLLSLSLDLNINTGKLADDESQIGRIASLESHH